MSNEISSSSEKLPQEINDLFIRMAHDLSEPIQALISDADVLRYQAGAAKSSKSTEKLNKLLDEISDRASNILETGLDLAHRVRKYLDTAMNGVTDGVVNGQVNLYRMLNSLVDNWEERATAHGVEIKPLFDSLRGINVQCDEIELKSALGHLIGNAIKYSFSGRHRPQDSSSKFDRYVTVVGGIEQGRASIEFQNYGVGIHQQELMLVKQKYYRGELAVKEGRAGTGRGLWAASTFFESIGGNLEVNSEYKGSDSSTKESPYLTKVKVLIPYFAPKED